MASKYVPSEFESKWVEKWEKERVYTAPDEIRDTKYEKRYVLSMFPYPSGSGLHVGHVRIFTGTDILARYFRMKGHAVLHPMGWDAFGLPAENAAIKAKKNPIDMVPQNIANFKKQMQTLGLSYDWSREFSTTDPDYYKWTQWLFLQLYSVKNKKGERLVYRSNAPIRWCPSCKTGLANEEVLADGAHERCGTQTVEKLVPQWMMRITDYAERLLSELDPTSSLDTSETSKGQVALDWPKGILEMQKNWIGKKEGMIIHHKIEGLDYQLDTFTAYPQWSFADSFIVVTPEHELVKIIINNDAVTNYLQTIQSQTPRERTENTEKTGVFTGLYVIDPFRPNDKMPIWIANFAVMDFGTGAIRCSAHDPRDVEFAKKYNIPLREVVDRVGDAPASAHDNTGILKDSGPFTGRDVGEISKEFCDWIEKEKIGERKTTYHLRDWIFSRQRYWGEPFPLIYCDICGDENGVVTVPESDLPVTLPYVKSYEPTETGESPLSQIGEWVNVKCPQCGGEARRETDTMPNWAGSCWYFLYFARSIDDGQNFRPSELASRQGGTGHSSLDPAKHGLAHHSLAQTSTGVENFNASSLEGFPNIKNFKLKIENSGSRWLPVDWYLGGTEHAVLHLLYSRFWIKVFYDLGLVGFTEPFIKLRNVGMVLATDNKKMSKSLGNVVSPDEVIKEYGADALRVYEAFMAPFSQEVAWSTAAVQGSYRFLTRIWQIYTGSDRITDDPKKEDAELVAKLQSVILKISSDITDVKYNTSIAAMMGFINAWEENQDNRHSGANPPTGGEAIESQNNEILSAPESASRMTETRKLHTKNAKVFLQLLAPFAPFITDELWRNVFNEKESIHVSSWPEADKTAGKNASVKIPIQVNGKIRDLIVVPVDKVSEKEVLSQALKSEKVKKWVGDKEYKVIYIEGKILNLVIE